MPYSALKGQSWKSHLIKDRKLMRYWARANWITQSAEREARKAQKKMKAYQAARKASEEAGLNYASQDEKTFIKTTNVHLPEPPSYLCRDGWPVRVVGTSTGIKTYAIDADNSSSSSQPNDSTTVAGNVNGATDAVREKNALEKRKLTDYWSVCDVDDSGSVVVASESVNYQSGQGEVVAWMLPQGNIVYRTKLPASIPPAAEEEPVDDEDDEDDDYEDDEENDDSISGNLSIGDTSNDPLPTSVVMDVSGSDTSETAFAERMLEICWTKKLMVTAECKWVRHSFSEWVRIHLYDITEPMPKRVFTWPSEGKEIIPLARQEIFLLPNRWQRQIDPDAPTELVMTGFIKSHSKAAVLIRIDVDQGTSTFHVIGDQHANCVRFCPQFPDLVLIIRDWRNLDVRSSYTNEFLATTKVNTETRHRFADTKLATVATPMPAKTFKSLVRDDTRGIRVVTLSFDDDLYYHIAVYQLLLPHPDVYKDQTRTEHLDKERPMLGKFVLLIHYRFEALRCAGLEIVGHMLFLIRIKYSDKAEWRVFGIDLDTGKLLYRSRLLDECKQIRCIPQMLVLKSDAHVYTIGGITSAEKEEA